MASKKKVTPARQKALQEYNKERRRIYSIVHNAEKRGYLFERGVVPPTVSELNFKNVPTVTIKAQTRKLREVKPVRLYKHATAVSFETGKIVTGTQKRKEERHQSAIVGSINRKEKQKELRSVQHLREYWQEKENEIRRELGKEPVSEKEEKDYGDYGTNLSTEEAKPWEEETGKTTPDESSVYFDKEEQEFQAQQAERDKANRQRLEQDQSYREMFNQGNIILQNIQQMIDDAMTNGTYKQAGMDLSIELSQQISMYGKDKVALAIAQAPQEAIEDAQVALNYNPGDERHDKAIVALRELITGEIPSAEELKEMQDRMDADAYTDDIG